ncbi:MULTISPECIES: DUF427 domain-containing protein [unclassified Nocardia]|uniref:DUF427 domain-containing protein n=1 Tax=unclassified Nocardia TaxID=2637762 RepID=UPI002E1C59F4
MTRPVLQPGPDHPITVTPHPERIVVRVHGQVVIDTQNALVLQEASYPPVYYLPLADAEESVLERTDTATYCPYKGDASYFTVSVDGAQSIDAGWAYESPYPAVAEIKDHIAFYPDRVDAP